MNTSPHSDNQTFTPSDYKICIAGRLGAQTAAWFEDMTLSLNEETSPPQTIIRGYVADQAALYGLINRARDLGLTLLSIKRLDQPPGQAEDSRAYLSQEE